MTIDRACFPVSTSRDGGSSSPRWRRGSPWRPSPSRPRPRHDRHQRAGGGRGEDSRDRRRDSGLPRDAGGRRAVSRGPRGARDLRRPRAHQGHLPPAGQAGLPGRRSRALRTARRRVEDPGFPRDRLEGGLQGPRCPGDVGPGRDGGMGQGSRQGKHGEARHHRVSAGAGGSSGCTRPTIPT